MAVNESLSAYSTTAASNTPAGTDAVGTDLDDHLRDIKRLIKVDYTNARGPSSPDIVAGRLWYDSSGSASAFAVLKIGDGAQDIALFELNESANTTLPYFGSTVAGSAGASFAQQTTKASAVAVIDAVDEGMALSAGPGLSGGGTFSATRTLSLAVNSLETLTASATAAMTLPVNNGSAERAATMKNLIGSVAASQAQMETAVSSDTVTTPLNQKYHPLHPKAVGLIGNDGTSATVALSLATSISAAKRSAQGRVTVTWGTAFSTAVYCVSITIVSDAGTSGFGYVASAGGRTTTTCEIKTDNDAGSGRDLDFTVSAWGDQ